jgi:hypothetical protein
MRESAGNALEVGKDAVAPLVMKATKGGTEELAVIHRKDLASDLRTGAGRPLETFLERFQLGCRAGIGPAQRMGVQI